MFLLSGAGIRGSVRSVGGVDVNGDAPVGWAGAGGFTLPASSALIVQ